MACGRATWAPFQLLLAAAVVIALPMLGVRSARAGDLATAGLSLEPQEPGVPPPAGGSDENKHAFIDPDYPRPWTVQIEPAVWFVASSGKVKLPVTSGSGPGGFTTDGDNVRLSTLDLDSARLRATGEVHINADLWRFTFSGADASVSRDNLIATSAFRLGAVAVAPGDSLDIEFSLGTYEVSVGYQFWARDFQEIADDPENTIPIILRLYALGGVRVYDVDFDLRRNSGPPARAQASEFFAEPIAGIRAEADFTKTFGIDVQITGGLQPLGSQTSYSIDIAAGFHYRPFENVGIQVGYRQVAYTLSDGEDLGAFEYDGRLAGLVVGVTIRF